MQLIEIDDESNLIFRGIYQSGLEWIDRLDLKLNATVDDLPPEILTNIFERLQDDKPTLYNCLFVSKLWCSNALSNLWYHFEFRLSLKSQLQVLTKLLSADPRGSVKSTNASFLDVRSLYLHVNLGGEIVVNTDRCQEIANTLRQFIHLLNSCPTVRELRIHLHPFVESNAHRSVWPELRSLNSLIDQLVEFASSRPYSELFLDVPQPQWHFEEGLSDIYFNYIQSFGPQITRLNICETASVTWEWLKPLTNLRRLAFQNRGIPGEDALSKFWDTIERLPLEELNLSRVNFPRKRKFKSWKFLSAIILNQFYDVEGTCSTILHSFPHLRRLGLHNPIVLPSVETSVPVKKIVCSNLRTIEFTRCKPQKHLLSLIAKTCPHLRVCSPPDNASDDDIIAIIDSCKFLDTLTIDGCTNLTSLAIHSLPRTRRLRSVLFHTQHLEYLDERCILALVDSCPDLHSRGCRVAALGEKVETFQRVKVRGILSGTGRYKRWLLRFIKWRQYGPAFQRITIDIDEIRKETEKSLV